MVRHPKVAVVLASTKEFSGRVIRWASHSPINHAMLVYEDPLWTGFWSAEALPRKGVIRPPFDPDDPRYLKLEFYVYNGNPEVGLRDLRWLIGSDYDYAGAIIGTMRLIFRKIFGTLSNMSIHDHKKLFCFELVTRYLQNLRVAGAESLIPENTSPAILREWLIKHPDFQRVSVERFMEDTSEIPFAKLIIGR
jgi:hypothetical protein